MSKARINVKKLNDLVSVVDFGAVGDGVTNASTAFQAAVDSGARRVYVPDGTYLLSSVVTITTTLTLFGPGKIKEAVLRDATILVSNAADVRIEDLTFEGPETRAAWDAGGAGYRQAFKAFIKFDTCLSGLVRNTYSSGKRGVVWCNLSDKVQITGNRHDGFLGTIASPATDANWYSCFNIQGGRENVLSDNAGNNCGSVVLIALDSSYNSVSNTTGRNSHDNFVYNSSGDFSSFIGGSFDAGVGSGVKVRGSGHVVQGYVIRGCGSSSPSISLTGNGLTPDAFNANGHSTIASGNVIVNSSGHAIQIGGQDGLFPRDFIVANNTIENHTGTANFSAIEVTAERGAKVVNNLIRGSTANYAMGIFGEDNTNKAVGFDVSGNTIANCAVGIRMQNVDASIVSNNGFADHSGYAIDARLCDDNFIQGNTAPGANGIRLSAAAGEECFDNIAVNNNVLGFIGAAANKTGTPIQFRYDVWTPTYATTGTGFGAVTYDAETQGYYVKMNNLVHITGFIKTDAITVGSATGDVVIGGLPFAVANDGIGTRATASVVRFENFAGDYPSGGFLNRNEQVIRLYYRATPNGVDAPLEIADLGTGANANGFVFSATYFTDAT